MCCSVLWLPVRARQVMTTTVESGWPCWCPCAVAAKPHPHTTAAHTTSAVSPDWCSTQHCLKDLPLHCYDSSSQQPTLELVTSCSNLLLACTPHNPRCTQMWQQWPLTCLTWPRPRNLLEMVPASQRQRQRLSRLLLQQLPTRAPFTCCSRLCEVLPVVAAGLPHTRTCHEHCCHRLVCH